MEEGKPKVTSDDITVTEATLTVLNPSTLYTIEVVTLSGVGRLETISEPVSYTESTSRSF